MNEQRAACNALDRLPDAVLVVDREGTIVGANAAASELTGYRREELVGCSCQRLLEPRTSAGGSLPVEGWHAAARLASVRLLPAQSMESRHADGHTVAVSVTGRYERASDGRLQGAVLALRRARQADAEATRELVAMVSHELRAPLTSIKGYTGLLLSRWARLDEEQKLAMLRQVDHDSDRVARLIAELLDVSRLQGGRLRIRPAIVDLASLATSVVDSLRLEYPDLEVDIAFAPGFPRVVADPDRIEQVLANLLENAAKYASPRGIHLRGKVGEREMEVAVVDQGPGIPADLLDRVFDKFSRLPETRPSGLGLGLWIARGVIEAHGGRLSASSVPGQGSTFRFTLPIVALEEP